MMTNEAMGLICANYNTDRLVTQTENRPVASLPFGGRYRLMDFVLSNMVNAGLRTVGLVTPYMYRSMLDHLGAGKEWFLDRKRGGLFILPGSIYGFKNMSTQFLVKDMTKNMEYLVRDNKNFVILASANQVYNMDYADLIEKHARSGADATMVYKIDESLSPAEKLSRSFLELSPRGRVIDILTGAQAKTEAAYNAKDFVPKSMFADCLIIGRQKMVDIIGWYQAVDHMDFIDVIRENLNHLDVRGYEFSGYLGRVEAINSSFKCSMDILSPDVHEELFFSERPIYTKVKDGVPTRYIKSAHVSNCLIPNECTIMGRVENSIVFPNVVVESGAIVRDSVIMQGGIIGKNAIVENVIADKYVSISEGTFVRGSNKRPIVLKKRSIM